MVNNKLLILLITFLPLEFENRGRMAVADIAKVTKLPEATKPSIQRWQQLPLRQKSRENSPCRTKTPKTARLCKTPKSTGKPKTPVHCVPKIKASKTPGKPKTPVHCVPKTKTSKTPKSTGKSKTPNGCR